MTGGEIVRIRLRAAVNSVHPAERRGRRSLREDPQNAQGRLQAVFSLPRKNRKHIPQGRKKGALQFILQHSLLHGTPGETRTHYLALRRIRKNLKNCDKIFLSSGYYGEIRRIICVKVQPIFSNISIFAWFFLFH